MTLKADEIFVADCLVQYFGGPNNAKWWEGEDPPDIYLEIGRCPKAVEITQLSPPSFDNQGMMKNRTTEDMFAVRLCNELDSSLGDMVPDNMTVSLALYVPVANPSKYRKELTKIIKTMLKSHPQSSKGCFIQVAGEKVGISAFQTKSHREKKIVGCVVNKGSNANILLSAQATLWERLATKEQKYKEIAFDGPKWLAFFNEYWLADFDTYTQALKSCPVKHSFQKLFVISGNRSVNEIYSKL